MSCLCMSEMQCCGCHESEGAPDAADKPAPETAMIFFDDLRMEANASMSLLGVCRRGIGDDRTKVDHEGSAVLRV